MCSRTYYSLTNLIQNYILIEEGRDKNFPSSQHVLLSGSQVEGAAQSAAKGSSSEGKGGKKNLHLTAKCINLHSQSSWGAWSGPCCCRSGAQAAPHSQPPGRLAHTPPASCLHNTPQLVLPEPVHSLESAITSINLFNLFLLALKLNSPSNEFTQRCVIKIFISVSLRLPCQVRLP